MPDWLDEVAEANEALQLEVGAVALNISKIFLLGQVIGGEFWFGIFWRILVIRWAGFSIFSEGKANETEGGEREIGGEGRVHGGVEEARVFVKQIAL